MIKKMPIRSINNIVKYVTTEIQNPVPVATDTLQANEIQKLFPVVQGFTSILEFKTPINKANSNRARLGYAVRAIFHTPK